jgi:hypothetical protein
MELYPTKTFTWTKLNSHENNSELRIHFLESLFSNST